MQRHRSLEEAEPAERESDALHEAGAPSDASLMESGRVLVGQPVDLDDGRRDTPVVPARPARAERAQATLTVMTGLDAGRPFLIPPTGLTIGRAPDMDLVADDRTVSARHARVRPRHDGTYCIEDLGSTNGTFVGSSRVERVALATGDRVQLGSAFRLRFAVSDAGDVALHAGLYESSIRDALTRAFNRRYLAERLVLEIVHARRVAGAVAVLLFDLDRFKALNDEYGHLAGDRALVAVANEVRRTMRQDDVFARYGGEEFVILARDTTHADAIRLAHRVRRAIAELWFSARRRRFSVTTSVGVASLCELVDPSASGDAIIALADARLYIAKAAGRDCVRAGPESFAPRS